MLRHLKLKRQEQDKSEAVLAFSGKDRQLQQQSASLDKPPVSKPPKSTLKAAEAANGAQAQRRVRGRRSSKPQMEKRRRARINECLDILKSYVLNDATNLSELGIDATARENQDEETIARSILKSSGLIHRHRGRKNPNKLEKADILELTVAYVRKLHTQRDHWMCVGQSKLVGSTLNATVNRQLQQSALVGKATAAFPLTSPLLLNLPELNGNQHTAALQPTPPPSSASSSPQPLLSISNNISNAVTTNSNASVLGDVLDLSDSKRTRINQSHAHQVNQATQQLTNKHIYKDGVLLIQSTDGCWHSWSSTALPS